MQKPGRISQVAQWLDERLQMIRLPRAFAVCSLSERMPQVETAWHKVRLELEEIGLLYDAGEEGDGYLDQIELVVSPLPSFGSAGYIYDSGVSPIHKLVGFEEGVIYLPADTPHIGTCQGILSLTLFGTSTHTHGIGWTRNLLTPFGFKRPLDTDTRRNKDRLIFGTTPTASISITPLPGGIPNSERNLFLSTLQPGTAKTSPNRLCTSCGIEGALTDSRVALECIES